jgi:hypothetical protein
MQKHYFELDKVSSITLTMKKESDYKWYEAIPSIPVRFLGIKYGMTSPIIAGWSTYSLEYHSHDNDRKQSSYFNDYKWYRVDESNKMIYFIPRVEIRFMNEHTIVNNFESNEEAQDYIDELIECSEKEFHVIVNEY